MLVGIQDVLFQLQNVNDLYSRLATPHASTFKSLTRTFISVSNLVDNILFLVIRIVLVPSVGEDGIQGKELFLTS